jgi:hypothetical protein
MAIEKLFMQKLIPHRTLIPFLKGDEEDKGNET